MEKRTRINHIIEKPTRESHFCPPTRSPKHHVALPDTHAIEKRTREAHCRSPTSSKTWPNTKQHMINKLIRDSHVCPPKLLSITTWPCPTMTSCRNPHENHTSAPQPHAPLGLARRAHLNQTVRHNVRNCVCTLQITPCGLIGAHAA